RRGGAVDLGFYVVGFFSAWMSMRPSPFYCLSGEPVQDENVQDETVQDEYWFTLSTIVPRLQIGLLIVCALLIFQSAFLAAPAEAQQTALQQSASQQTPAATKPGDVNLEYSRVFIFVDRTTSLGHTHGVEGKLKSGRLSINAKEPGSLVFDMKSFIADTETARKVLNVESTIDEATRRKVNENMLGPEILNVNRYPEAKFENIRVTATGKTSNRKLPEYILEGDFTLHKTTRHLQIRCDLEEKDGWHHVRGSFKILQTDYGIKPYTKMLGAVGIKDELMILGDIWLVPAP
ncbi:MAG: YceI family protein, partial [Pirellula sp.]